ncbi:MAG TPA: tetratricopeptide repeat protein, partial [Gaiellaceae bacterium]
AERAVVERAAVVGQEFWLAAVDHLLDEEEARPLARHVQALVRKDLVRPHRSFLAGEEAFLFNHVLIRNAAYRSISKELRADLHERFASWLEEKGSEYGEIIGYHLEQAWQCRRDLGPSDDRTRALGEKAAELLGEAGGRALQRGDMAAAANLLARTAALLETDASKRLEILPKLGSALARVGELERADAVLSEAIDSAHARGDRQLELVAMVERSSWRLWSDPWSQTEPRDVAERAIRVFEDAGDELGLAKAWHLLADVESSWRSNTEALERALVHARRAGDRREEADILWWLTVSFYFGPMHADEAIRHCNEILDEAKGDRAVEAGALGILAGLHAMRGRFEEARDMFADGIRILEELGFTLRVATRRTVSGAIELLAGDPAAAERELRWGFERLEAIGEHQDLQGIAGQLAEALYRQGRYAEAERFAEVSETEEHERTRWRGPNAKLLARRGELERAQSIARETASRAGQNDNLNSYGKALMDLAEVLQLSGRRDEAEAAVQQALGVYEQKGNLVAERAAQVFQQDLQASALRGS